MKRLQTLLIIILVHSFTLAAQDAYRFSYRQTQKRSLSDNNIYANDMKLDYDGRTSFYYCETSFRRDSLNVIAFDKRGEIVNQEAYGERTRLPGTATNDKSVIDFSKGEMVQLYNDVTYFEGKMPLELPQWTITENEEIQSDYLCKMAKGSYFGREWTLWFTEEIPVNAGPWLLWGLPGLIVYAKDSEEVFSFRLQGVEKIEKSRLESNLSYLSIKTSSPTTSFYSMSMKEMETMHTKYMRDVTYFNKIHGITDGYTEDRNGRRTEMQMTIPYIPYIADEYWKNR